MMGLALRLLWREVRAGELNVVFAALFLAVMASSTVGFFTDRVRGALEREAARLIAADLVVVADRPLPPAWEAKARALGLAVARTVSFPSMVVFDGGSQLVEVKAVSPGYPLRGAIEVAGRVAGSVPAPKTVWVEARLLAASGLIPGAFLSLGKGQFRIEGVIERAPDRAAQFFALAPRVMLHEADLPATGLLVPGSRASYRLLLAGEAAALAEFKAWASPRLPRGSRVEGVRDARPELRQALDRAGRYLALAALLAVVVAGVAVGLAARRFVVRHLDACAVMRCLGASQRRLLGVFVVGQGVLGCVAGLAGAAAGWLAQGLLAHLLGGLVGVALPPPSWRPAWESVALALALLAAFGFVPLLRLARVPSLRVLRRELGPPPVGALAGATVAVGVLAGLFLLYAGEWRLGLYVAGGFVALLFAAGAGGAMLVALGTALRRSTPGLGFYALANLGRRRGLALTSVMALAVGLMALFLAVLVRGELIAAWMRHLPPDAPNRFVIDIQPGETRALGDFFAQAGLARPELYPMVRGRLVHISGRPVSGRDYADEQTRHLVEREFNLSYADGLRADNRVVAGRPWNAAVPGWSVEEGIARRLMIRVGDTLSFEVAGRRVSAPVVNLRKVAWDSMRVNFFVIGTRGLLAREPATYVTSFYLPPGRETFVTELVRAFPHLTVIDVGAITRELTSVLDRMVQAMQFVFGFTLAAGLVVLYAAVVATRDERVFDAAVMRVLGARARQIRWALALEFGAIGLVAGLLAALFANLTAWLLASRVLELDYGVRPGLLFAGAAAGALLVTGTGLLATRRVLRLPPLVTLRT